MPMASLSVTQALTEKFQHHKSNQATGIVHVGVGKKAQWSIYFHMGRMVWAHARTHPVRRWYRQIEKHCPQLLEGFDQNYAALHYSKLVEQVRKGDLNRINLAKAVEDYLSEILFDIVHQGTLRALHGKPGLTLSDEERRYASSMFLIVRAEQAWQQTQYDWQAWQQAELVKCSPNLAPKIGNAEALKKQTSAAVYEHLISIIDGEHTFRDLSVQLNQPLLPLTRRIVPYVRQGLLGLVRLGDLSSPSDTKPTPSAPAPSTPKKTEQPQSPPASINKQPTLTAKQSISPVSQTGAQKRLGQKQQSVGESPKVASNAPLIIYIDDSPADSRVMGRILQDAGFRFRSIQESTHALPLLIEHKPQMLFLDLVMPVANGYEICSQVRRVSLFKDIPIVIITSNNSLADRVHAKMVGASGFLGKPINRERVLRTVHKLLGERSSLAHQHGANVQVESHIEKARRLRTVGAAKS